MFTTTVTYTDFNGIERTETCRFNLSQPEVIEMEASYPGGLEQILKNIIAEKDPYKILAVFKKLLLESYGEKTADGKRFVKSKEISEAFSQTGAYEQIYMRIMRDTDFAIEFTNKIMPERVRQEAAKIDADTIVSPVA